MKKLTFMIIIILLASCKQVKKDTTPPEIHLKPNVDTIEVGNAWIDSGCEAIDNKDGTIACIADFNNIDIYHLGEYQIVYKALDSSGNIQRVTRKVTVIDETKPVLSLISGVDTIRKGEIWTDTGITVTDNYDQHLDYSVSGNVNLNLVGEYIITYTAVDSSGNHSSIVRYVNIVE